MIPAIAPVFNCHFLLSSSTVVFDCRRWPIFLFFCLSSVDYNFIQRLLAIAIITSIGHSKLQIESDPIPKVIRSAPICCLRSLLSVFVFRGVVYCQEQTFLFLDTLLYPPLSSGKIARFFLWRHKSIPVPIFPAIGGVLRPALATPLSH